MPRGQQGRGCLGGCPLALKNGTRQESQVKAGVSASCRFLKRCKEKAYKNFIKKGLHRLVAFAIDIIIPLFKKCVPPNFRS